MMAECPETAIGRLLRLSFYHFLGRADRQFARVGSIESNTPNRHEPDQASLGSIATAARPVRTCNERRAVAVRMMTAQTIIVAVQKEFT